MMNDEDYVWYTDENGKLRSVGYPIENMFKEANIPAIMGGCDIFSQDSGSLAIPAGLVYMNSLVSKMPNESHCKRNLRKPLQAIYIHNYLI